MPPTTRSTSTSQNSEANRHAAARRSLTETNLGGLPSNLRACMLLDALELHPRPTFILDISAAHTQLGGKAVYCNPALRVRTSLYNAVLAVGAAQIASATETSSEELELAPILWDRPWEYYTINGQWRVVSTTSRSDIRPAPGTKGFALGGADEDSLSGLSTPKIAPSSALSTPFNRFMFEFKWEGTGFGPMDLWSRELTETFKMLLTDPKPAVLFWGPAANLMYNEPCLPLLSEQHPAAIGRPVEEVYPDAAQQYHVALLDRLRKTGLPEIQSNVELHYVKEKDFLEDVYLDYTSIPVFNNDDVVLGVYQSVTDVTEYNLTQRRNTLLAAVNTISGQIRQLDNVWIEVISKLRNNGKDIPHALIYSLTPDIETPMQSWCQLEGSLSWESTTDIDRFEVGNNKNSLAVLFRHSMALDSPLYFTESPTKETVSQPLSPELKSHFANVIRLLSTPGDAYQSIVVLPLRKVHSQKVIGYLILGVNPRLPYDSKYEAFMVSLQYSIATSISSSLLWEEEMQRAKRAEAQIEITRADLAAQLLHQTKEAQTNELRFAQFARHAPIGICVYNSDGSMAFANAKWYQLTEFSPEADNKSPGWWASIVHQDDLPIAFTHFSQLQIDNIPVHFEIRLGVPSKQYSSEFTWVLVSAYPELTQENELESIVACFTDISEQKWAAEIEKRRTEDAIEAKRQQESFVDITSHEIRNPLSAVLQCAEEISAIAKDARDAADESESSLSLQASELKDIIQAAEIIEQCTLHQKRIVDDILTLSKMNGGLLPVIAAPNQPLTIVRNSINFFGRQLSQTGTKITFEIDPSYSQIPASLDWLDLDAGRLNQMLVNLLTNAIKFTKSEARRLIELKIGASLEPQPLGHWPLDFLPSLNHKIETVGAEWPVDECVYLHFIVSDTGSGMALEEQKSLFARFSQGSAKTYSQYGGSGLGLYICRALVEIHGGQIGFRSTSGVGSSFGFFIKTRTAPKTQVSIESPSTSKSRGIPPDLSDHMKIDHAAPMKGNQLPALDIMIVEDNIINQKVLSKQLIRQAHRVSIANHGLECLDLLSLTHFCQKTGGTGLSVILMDIEMPIMDGMACTLAIRKMQSDGKVAGHVPIIAITGNARSEKVKQILDAGVDEVVLKPFTVPALLKLCEKLLGRADDTTNR